MFCRPWSSDLWLWCTFYHFGCILFDFGVNFRACYSCDNDAVYAELVLNPAYCEKRQNCTNITYIIVADTAITDTLVAASIIYHPREKNNRKGSFAPISAKIQKISEQKLLKKKRTETQKAKNQKSANGRNKSVSNNSMKCC